MARPIEVPVVVKKGTLSRSIEGESKAAFRRMGSSSSAVAPLGRMLGKIRSDADEFTKSIEASNARVIAFGASVGVINGISNAFKKLVEVTISVEKSLVDINVVMNAGAKELAKFGDGLFKVAKNTATSFEVVAEAATEFARQGLTTEETLKRVNDSLILTRLTGLKAADSVKGLTAAVNGFGKAGLTTTQIINKLAAVDVKFAVSADDLIDALSRTGAVAQDAGLSLDELVGMVTAAQQTTARGGAVIGNAFKTIFTRIQRPETLKTLRQLNIAVDDASGKALSARKVMEQLAISYDGLSKSAKDAVNQQVAGVFQINILKAAIGDLQSQNSIAARATQISAAATDEATKKNQQLNTTIAALTTQTGLALTELAKKIGDIALAPGMRDIISSFKALVEGTTGVLDGEGTGSRFAKGLLTGIGSVLTGPGLIVIGGVFIKLFKDLTVFGVKSLKNLLGLNNAAKAQAALQQGIGQLLATNVAYEQAMAAAAGNLNKQAAITQTYLAKEITMRAEAAALTSAMAGSAFAGGFRVTGSGEVAKKSKFFGGGRGKVPGLAPTEGVPNFAARVFNPRVTKTGGTLGRGGDENPFQFTSASMLGTSENYRGTFNLNASKAALAKQLPTDLADIVRNSTTMSGFQMQTKMAGFSPSQQTRMIEQMKDAVSTVPGLSDVARNALTRAHTGQTDLIGVNREINKALKKEDISTKDRGAYDQHMSERVTERSFNRAFGTVGTGGRQGADYAIDAVRYRGGRTDPMELKKLAGFTTGDATTIASAMKKQLVSGTNPALRNRLREEAQRQNKLPQFEQAMLERYAKEYRSYVINNRGVGGIANQGGTKTYFNELTRDQLTKSNLSNLSPAQRRHLEDEVLRYNRQVLNFAPIGDAIQREKMQVGGLLGMSPSRVQTRVVQNTALRSSFNPQGFGVISPTVGQHSFADAARMHRGQDLRTVNMAPGDIIRPNVPDLSKVDWGKVEATPMGHRAPTPKFIVAGIVPEAAKDFGTATAKAITHEAKKSYPTPSKRGITIQPPVDKVKAAQMAAPAGGFGNAAMNAFMGYSVGTMVDPLAQGMLGTTEGFMPGAITGGMLGRYGGKGLAASDRLNRSRFGKSKIGGKLIKGLPMLGTVLGALGGGAAGTYDYKNQEFLSKHGATGKQLKSMAVADMLPAAMRGFGAVSTQEAVDQVKERYRNQINYTRRGALESIRDTTARTARGVEQAQIGVEGVGGEIRESARLARAARGGGISELDVVRRSAKIRRDTTAADRANKRQQFISQQSTGLVQGMGDFGYMGEGPEELRIRNLIRENLVRGNYAQVDEFFRSAANPEYSGPGAIRGLRKGLVPKEYESDLDKLAPVETRGFYQAGFQSLEGVITPEAQSRMGSGHGGGVSYIAKTIKAMGQSEQFTKMGTSVLKTAEAYKELQASMDFAEKVAQLNDALDETAARMKDVNRFTSGFSASFADAFSNMTTGASSAKDAMRDFAVSVLRSINRIQSEKLAQQLTGYLFPEGGKGQGFLSKLFGGGKQAGGLIQAQNGMYISGSRTGDKNPALLEDGEYVLNKKFVQGVGKENLDAMNFGMFPRFGKAKGGFMGGIGKMLGLPFTLLAKLFSGIFGGGGGGRETAPMITGAGSSAQSKRLSATNSKISETNEIMAQLDAISARRGAAPAATVDPKMAGIERRALASRAERQLKGNLKAYGGIRPGALGLPGQAIDGQWSGGRTHTISHIQASKHLTNLMHKGAAQGGPAALTPMLLELGNNPGMFDGMILGGVKFGPDVSILRKVAALQTMMEGRGIQFQTGGRLVSPISQSGVKRSALDEIIKENEFLPPVTGLGSAIGGGGSSLRLGIEDSRLSGFAHSNDPTLQSVRGDIQEWHQEQRDKKFEKQAKRDEMTQMIVGAVISSVVGAGVNKLSAKNKPLTPDQFDKLENPNTAEYNSFDDPVALGLTAPAGGGAPKAPGMMTAIKQMRNSKIGKFAGDAYSNSTAGNFKRDFSRGPDSAYGGRTASTGRMFEGFRPEPGAYGPGFGKGAFSSDWDWKGSSVGPGGRAEMIRGNSDNPFADFEKNFIEFIKEQEAGWPNRGEYKWQRGGHIDNIPAMLTGGEFVMSSSAVRRHGSGALHKLNRGGRIGYQEGGLVGDQQFVPAEGNSADKKQSGTTKSGDSNTTINITVNSSTGETNTSTNGEAGASEREMAVRLADAVKTVLKQEKRTGGMLRDVTSNDQ